jgi:hypothetical protein
MAKAKDPVGAFLHRKTFFCRYLAANLTPEECCDRQKRKVEEQRFGRKFLMNNDPQSRYCRSGDCKQGAVQVVKLRARRKKAREQKAAAKHAAR